MGHIDRYEKTQEARIAALANRYMEDYNAVMENSHINKVRREGDDIYFVEDGKVVIVKSIYELEHDI